MLNPTKKNGGWAIIEAEIRRGEYPPVFVNSGGRLCLDNGTTRPEFPPRLAALLPAELREQAAAKAHERSVAMAAENAKWRAEIAERERADLAAITEHGQRRCWRLDGFYIEDISLARYTYAELLAWRDWSAYRLRHAHPRVGIVCERAEGDHHIDWSGYFADVCNDGHETPDFEALAADLRQHVEARRRDAAGNN